MPTFSEVYVAQQLLRQRGVRFVQHGKSTTGTWRNEKGQFVTGKPMLMSESARIAADRLLLPWSKVKDEAAIMDEEMTAYSRASHGGMEW